MYIGGEICILLFVLIKSQPEINMTHWNRRVTRLHAAYWLRTRSLVGRLKCGDHFVKSQLTRNVLHKVMCVWKKWPKSNGQSETSAVRHTIRQNTHQYYCSDGGNSSQTHWQNIGARLQMCNCFLLRFIDVCYTMYYMQEFLSPGTASSMLIGYKYSFPISLATI